MLSTTVTFASREPRGRCVCCPALHQCGAKCSAPTRSIAPVKGLTTFPTLCILDSGWHRSSRLRGQCWDRRLASEIREREQTGHEDDRTMDSDVSRKEKCPASRETQPKDTAEAHTLHRRFSPQVPKRLPTARTRRDETGGLDHRHTFAGVQSVLCPESEKPPFVHPNPAAQRRPDLRGRTRCLETPIGSPSFRCSV